MFACRENLKQCLAMLSLSGGYCAVMSNNPLIKHGKALFEVFLASKHVQKFSNIFQAIMSWKTVSSDVGLAGLTPVEVAKEALF